jgi:hypothetical protein
MQTLFTVLIKKDAANFSRKEHLFLKPVSENRSLCRRGDVSKHNADELMMLKVP